MRRLAVLVIAGLSVGAAQAQEPKADCRKFGKTSDGRWYSKVESKVGNPKAFAVLQPGLPIARDMTIVGINVSETIDRLCGGQ